MQNLNSNRESKEFTVCHRCGAIWRHIFKKYIKFAQHVTMLMSKIGQFVITFQTTLHDPPNKMCLSVWVSHRDIVFACIWVPICMSHQKGFCHGSDQRQTESQTVSWLKMAAWLRGKQWSCCLLTLCVSSAYAGRRRCLYFPHTISIARYVPQTSPWQASPLPT